MRLKRQDLSAPLAEGTFISEQIAYARLRPSPRRLARSGRRGALRVRFPGRANEKKSSHLRGSSFEVLGGDEGNRTLGLCHATAALSQLSYVPKTRDYDSRLAPTVNGKMYKKRPPHTSR